VSLGTSEWFFNTVKERHIDGSKSQCREHGIHGWPSIDHDVLKRNTSNHNLQNTRQLERTRIEAIEQLEIKLETRQEIVLIMCCSGMATGHELQMTA
jgi:hypothetical protein